MKMIESTFQHFLDIKNNRKNDLLETTLYPIVKGIVTPDNLFIPGTDIWNKITESFDGRPDEKDSTVYHSDDFGNIHRITVTKMICDKFGAEIEHKMRGNNLLFDYNHLMAMEKIYKNDGKIRTQPVLDDSMIQQDQPVEMASTSNHNKIELEDDDSRIGPFQQVENVESSNHIEKCPYCDHEDQPYFLKIHVLNAHKEQQNGI